MTSYYPFHDDSPLIKEAIISGLGIAHVFLTELATGGGMLLCYFEWLRRTGRSRSAARFVNGSFPAVVLVAFGLGTMTGLALWFTSITVNPDRFGGLVDEFQWLWAIAWTFFCTQMVSGSAFLRYKDRLSSRGRMLLPVIYSVAAWSSLLWINGILSFPWAARDVAFMRHVWWGFWIPSAWPWLLYRTIASMAIAALAACVVINVTVALEREARRELIGQACIFLGPMVLMPLLAMWFLASIPHERRSSVLGGNVTMTTNMGIGIVMSMLIGVYALAAPRYRRLSINGVAAALLCTLAFAATALGECVRESVGKPYSVREVLDFHRDGQDGRPFRETSPVTSEPVRSRDTSKVRP